MVKSLKVRGSDLSLETLTSTGKVRDELIRDLMNEMIGPRNGDEEVVMQNPQSLYLTGMLFPQTIELDSDNQESNKNLETEPDDDDINNRFSMKQSSIGITCILSKDVKSEITATIRYGTYRTESKKPLKIKRNPWYEQKFEIKITEKKTGGEIYPLKDHDWLQFEYSYERIDNEIFLHAYVVNTKQTLKSTFKNISFQTSLEISSDDPIIEHRAPKTNKFDSSDRLLNFLFKNKNNFGYGHSCAIEWKSNDVVDRKLKKIKTTFIPHYIQRKISRAEPKDFGLEKTVSMKELFSVENFEDYKELLMPLVTEYDTWIKESLEQKLSEETDNDNREILKEQIAEAKKARDRISGGINLVSTEKNAAIAFRFANKVMALQQSRQNKIKESSNHEFTDIPKDEDLDAKWHLFQLGFILMNLDSIVHPTIENRKITDLLWFPTGGGKTEAYLGLIAFTMALRRLSANRDPNGRLDEEAYGVTVMMRYTLRLLTIQQFQRAAALMCACEYERRHDLKTWGTMQFNVGLWVGRKTTPNQLMGKDDYSSAERTLSSWRDPETPPKEHNPVQLLNCPWCGSQLGKKNYTVYEFKEYLLPNKCRAFCSNSNCIFSQKYMQKPILENQPSGYIWVGETCLPILVVDEDIYKWCPSLLIGTVDKFAQLAWSEKTSAIFGTGLKKSCQKCGFINPNFDEGHIQQHQSDYSFWDLQKPIPPPELIVQDELHLICGPMGTMVALYETAIDYFCTKTNGIKPKIIASTATTRAASEQIMSLFNREETRIFPPQGYEFGETFFSTSDENQPKIFLGVCSTATSGLTVQGRISASLMSKIRSLRESSQKDGLNIDSLLDPYYTLVSYYNSMRELGGAGSSYRDAVPDFIENYYQRVTHKPESSKEPEQTKLPETTSDPTGITELLASTEEQEKIEFEKALEKRKYAPSCPFLPINPEELTGRQDSGEIPKVLKQLDVKLGNKDVIDLLLSTNMLSVGVDIQRLGLMIINGQPKNHSEYIQASGRIGRSSPGLIITMYNALKPRDLSHFENFAYYHSTFFKNVEPISLTPFATRARDKGLFGVIVAMIRNIAPILSQQSDAKKFSTDKKQIKDAINVIKETFETRVDDIDSAEVQETLKQIDELFAIWEDYANQELPLVYKSTKWTKKEQKQNFNYLLKSIELGQAGLAKLPATPQSLREAEQEQLLYYWSENEDVAE